jgi:hypothetical protein
MPDHGNDDCDDGGDWVVGDDDGNDSVVVMMVVVMEMALLSKYEILCPANILYFACVMLL